MDEAQQPEDAGTPGAGTPGDGASNGRHEPLPPDDSAAPDVGDSNSGDRDSGDTDEPATPRPSTLESWMAAAAAAEKKKPVSSGERRWYILKVQSNREDSIREALQKRIRIQGLDAFFGDIIVPIEKVTEFKNGKKRVVKRKLYPGYIVVNMELNDDTWFLVRETGGIGDFTGSGGKPSPMLDSEVKKIVKSTEEQPEAQEKIAIPFKKGDRTKITEGMFENYEGEVDAIDMSNGRVTVLINIFGRPVPVELEHWQLESL
jgi:transcription termination/antitermination protein NusG